MIYEIELDNGQILELDSEGKELSNSELKSYAQRYLAKQQGAMQQASQETPEQRAERFKLKSQQIKAQKGDAYRRQAEEAGAFEAFGVGVAEGAMNIARGLGIADKREGTEEQAYKALEEEHPIAAGVGEAAGESAPGMLLGGGIASIPKLGASLAKSLLKRVALTGGLSAAESAIAAKGKGAGSGEQMEAGLTGGIVAGAAEAAMPKVLRIGGKVLRRVVGKSAKGALVDAAGKPTQELVEALAEDGRKVTDLVPEEIEMLKGYAGKDAAQAERQAFLESMGFTKNAAPTKAQIQRTASAFVDQQEAAKLSGKVRGRLEEQNALLINKFDEPIENMGIDPKTTGNSIYDAVLNKATELDNQIHDMYKMADELTGGEAVVDPTLLANQLKASMPDNDLTGGLVKAIDGKAKQLGFLDADGNPLKKMTVGEAENLVQSINKRYSRGNPNSNRVGRILKDSLDDAVTKSGSPELYKQARQAKAAFHKELARSNASPFSRRQTSLTADILEETADPDKLAQAIYSNKYRTSEIRDLKRFLHSGTEAQKEAGKKAWDELKAETVENIKNAALGGARDERGNQTITRARLQKAMGKIGMDKLKEIFSPDEMKFFINMEKALELMEPVPGTALGEGPTGRAVNKAIDKLAEFTNTTRALKAFKDMKLQGNALKAAPAERFIPEPIVGGTSKALSLGAGAYAADKEYNR